MSRGRRPALALTEAERIALHRGAALPAPGNRYDVFDLLIFEQNRIVFVKVKRSKIAFTDPLEVLHHYRFDLARIHRVPLTVVSAREIWIRLPRGKWQFFLIRHDSIVEIQADGTHIPRAELPIPVREPASEEVPPEEGSSTGEWG
jgi:hypothetical protein